ncbi:MAG: MFS transporter [Bacillota bacterium]
MWIVGLVSLFTDISSEMLVPVLPIFLSAVLGTPAAAIGLIEGTAEAMASVMKAVSGYMSDRTGRRKPFMLLGYGLSNVVKPLMGFAGSWGQVLALRVSDRFGKGLRGAPRDALIAESSAPEVRGKAFGIHRGLDTLGAAIGPLTAWLILWAWPEQYRRVFWWAVLPGAISVVLLVFMLRDTRPERPASGPVLRNWSVSIGALPPRLRRFILIGTLFALGNSSDAFLILKAQKMGLATALVPVAYFTFNASYTLLSYPLGALSDRLGRKPLLIGGFLVFAVIYAGFALANVAWMAWPLFIGYGLYYAATEGIQKAYITDHALAASRGTAIGVFNALTGLAALPASLLAGFLWDQLSPAAPFWVGAATAALSAVLLLAWEQGGAAAVEGAPVQPR